TDLVVEDRAASGCGTSLEWAETLFALFSRARFEASDLVLFLILVEDRESGERFIVEQDGAPLQYVRPPFVIRMSPPEPLMIPVNWCLYQSARRKWRKARGAWPLPKSWTQGPEQETLDRGRYLLRKLPLIHPRALATARTDPRFTIRSRSVFETS